MRDTLIIIPTYNEAENIEDIIEAILAESDHFDILVVDDGSPDGTADLVASKMKKHPDRVHILNRTAKNGLGRAYIAGFQYALSKHYEYIFEMDADFSHNPKYLKPMRRLCVEGLGDVVVGSRYTEGGGVENWPMDRLILSKGASYYVKLITGMGVNDPTAGFKCYRREVLENIDLSKITFIGYAFQIALKYASHSLGYAVTEMPIIFKDREKGVSKMNTSIIKEAVTGVIKMKLNTIKDSRYYSKNVV